MVLAQYDIERSEEALVQKYCEELQWDPPAKPRVVARDGSSFYGNANVAWYEMKAEGFGSAFQWSKGDGALAASSAYDELVLAVSKRMPVVVGIGLRDDDRVLHRHAVLLVEMRGDNVRIHDPLRGRGLPWKKLHEPGPFPNSFKKACSYVDWQRWIVTKPQPLFERWTAAAVKD